jgi:hypothetical protein
MASCFCNGDSQNPIHTQFGDVSLGRNDKNLELNYKLIAHALGRLSLEERDKAYHDMHGVADEVHEEPEFLARKLNEIRDALLKLKSKLNHASTRALRLAETINPGYVKSRNFLLSFLRADRFDANQAAGRITRYLDWKLKLFGEVKLCKDITLDDLQEEDLTTMKKGISQRLPERDRAGRSVWVFFVQNEVYPSMESLVSRQNEGSVQVVSFGKTDASCLPRRADCCFIRITQTKKHRRRAVL